MMGTLVRCLTNGRVEWVIEDACVEAEVLGEDSAGKALIDLASFGRSRKSVLFEQIRQVSRRVGRIHQLFKGTLEYRELNRINWVRGLLLPIMLLVLLTQIAYWWMPWVDTLLEPPQHATRASLSSDIVIELGNDRHHTF
ncbi:MAG TPA: hypothetical protein VJJ22_00555 [Candidatus Paceibacterota bacterium]